MSWDLDTAKVYLGILPADTTKDAIITALMGTVSATAEKYLGRKLFRVVDYVESFYYVRSAQVSLNRYPVEAVTLDPYITNYFMHPEAGILVAEQFRNQMTVTVTYTGGYDETATPDPAATVLPLDLERVLWEIFLSYWAATDTTTGAPVLGASSSMTQTQGPLTRVTIPDFMSLTYANPASSAPTVITQDSIEVWGPLAQWAPILELYRSQIGAGVGFA